MSGVTLSSKQVERMKREAKAMRKKGTHTHLQALDELAMCAGFKDWRELMATQRSGDADFIAHAKQDVGRLLSEVNMLTIELGLQRELVEAMRKEVDRLQDSLDEHAANADRGD